MQIEEINLLYVAITRAKSSIYIPEELISIEFPPSKQIHILKTLKEEDGETIEISNVEIPSSQLIEKSETTKEKAYSVVEVRETYKDAYRSWTEKLDEELTIMFCEGINVRDMAKHFGRTKGAIYSRIKKLELTEAYEK